MTDMLEEMPTLAKVAAVVGIPGLIALYTVYTLSTGTATAAQVGAVDRKMDVHINRMEVMEGARETHLSEQTRLLRLMCLSVARTDTVRVECSR